MTLWSGRFEEELDDFAMHFGASLESDKLMALHDVAGSKAHAQMLCEQQIISEDDFAAIVAGLEQIEAELLDGSFPWDDLKDEDVHMAVERVLSERTGEAGGRLHTGRSRNDQVATDIRLLAKELTQDAITQLRSFAQSLLDAAEKNTNTIMPGYTHLQHAQPVLFAHHLLAYFWMLMRDQKRLEAAYEAADANPLGAAALAGTSYPIDRARTSELLDFERTIPNSLDAVSDRDYLLDLAYAASVCMMHLSRFCEELVLWSSQEFGFITLSDEWSTGSSIMPQKKNPDFAELVRGKVGGVYGGLLNLLVICKGLPLAYNKDLQESKTGPVHAIQELSACLQVCEGMVSSWTVNEAAMLESAKLGFTSATDVADYLAKHGMPFREAHAVVGKLVLACEKKGVTLEDLALSDFKAASELFDEDILELLDTRAIVDARTSYGGTATAAVKQQLEEARSAFAQLA